MFDEFFNTNRIGLYPKIYENLLIHSALYYLCFLVDDTPCIPKLLNGSYRYCGIIYGYKWDIAKFNSKS